MSSVPRETSPAPDEQSSTLPANDDTRGESSSSTSAPNDDTRGESSSSTSATDQVKGASPFDTLFASMASLSDASPSAARRVHELQGASYEELVDSVTRRFKKDEEEYNKQIATIRSAEALIVERQRLLEDAERRLGDMADGTDDVVELNVGGELLSTTRAVLNSAEGSYLSGMFSGNFEGGLKKDKENRIFLDVDPPLFKKILSYLRQRRIASPDITAPLPTVAEDMRAEYDILVKYLGLEVFMYGACGTSGNIFQKIAESESCEQSRLQAGEVIKVTLSSTGGVPSANHEEVFGAEGFTERALENSYGSYSNTIGVKFLKHRVLVESMEFRAKQWDLAKHMSHQWTFHHGSETLQMAHQWVETEQASPRMDVRIIGGFVDEIQWTFARDFTLEHIILHGRVQPKST